MKGFGILYKKMKLYFQKKKIKNLDRISEILRICIKMSALPSLLTVE